MRYKENKKFVIKGHSKYLDYYCTPLMSKILYLGLAALKKKT